MVTHSRSAQTGLSDIAEEFRELDETRRTHGLSTAEAERYHSLFSRLSDALASSERHRKIGTRQFLRIQFNMDLVIRTPRGEVLAACRDFGGGGCSLSCGELYQPGDDLWIDGVVIAGVRHALHGRAVVVWSRPLEGSTVPGYGLRFAIDSRAMRDQVDRVFYRALDLFLTAPSARTRRSARPSASSSPSPAL